MLEEIMKDVQALRNARLQMNQYEAAFYDFAIEKLPKMGTCGANLASKLDESTDSFQYYGDYVLFTGTLSDYDYELTIRMSMIIFKDIVTNNWSDLSIIKGEYEQYMIV